jgi:chloramphenicol 3-O phosphotransferase
MGRYVVLAPLPAYLVGVHCALETLEAREAARGDRLPGLARYLHRRPHEHVPFYDVEVDTGVSGPEACAEAIRACLAEGRPPRAFRASAAATTPPSPALP